MHVYRKKTHAVINGFFEGEAIVKKFIFIGVIVVVGFFVLFYLGDIIKVNKDRYEFTTFRSLLIEAFFPVLNDSYKHFDQAADEIDSNTFNDWYVLQNGLGENIEFQARVKEAEDRISLEKVSGEQALKLKDNSLKQLLELQEAFEILYDASNDKTTSEFNAHKKAFTTKVEKLSVLMEDMNANLNKNQSAKK